MVSGYIIKKAAGLAYAYNYCLAALSVADMVSDILMVVRYSERGETAFARACIMTIALNMLLQSFNVYGYYRKRPKLIQLREQLILFSLLKPGGKCEEGAKRRYFPV